MRRKSLTVGSRPKLGRSRLANTHPGIAIGILDSMANGTRTPAPSSKIETLGTANGSEIKPCSIGGGTKVEEGERRLSSFTQTTVEEALDEENEIEVTHVELQDRIASCREPSRGVFQLVDLPTTPRVAREQWRCRCRLKAVVCMCGIHSILDRY